MRLELEKKQSERVWTGPNLWAPNQANNIGQTNPQLMFYNGRVNVASCSKNNMFTNQQPQTYNSPPQPENPFINAAKSEEFVTSSPRQEVNFSNSLEMETCINSDYSLQFKASHPESLTNVVGSTNHVRSNLAIPQKGEIMSAYSTFQGDTSCSEYIEDFSTENYDRQNNIAFPQSYGSVHPQTTSYNYDTYSRNYSNNCTYSFSPGGDGSLPTFTYSENKVVEKPDEMLTPLNNVTSLSRLQPFSKMLETSNEYNANSVIPCDTQTQDAAEVDSCYSSLHSFDSSSDSLAGLQTDLPESLGNSSELFNTSDNLETIDTESKSLGDLITNSVTTSDNSENFSDIVNKTMVEISGSGDSINNSNNKTSSKENFDELVKNTITDSTDNAENFRKIVEKTMVETTA